MGAMTPDDAAPVLAPDPASARPWAPWSTLGELGKVSLYTRVFAHIGVLGFPVIVLLFAVAEAPRETAPWVGMALAAAVMAVHVPVFGVVELHPSFNAAPRRSHRRWATAAAVLSAVVWSTGCVLRLVGERGDVASWAGQALLVAGALAACAGVLPWWPRPWWTTLTLSLVTLSLTVPVFGIAGGLFPVFGTASMVMSAWYVGVVRQLDSARRAESVLKVSEERLRFAQELHDTMGRHLAAMSLKTQVALAFAQRDDDRLIGELEALQELARTSAADLRQVVAGYRGINLATELEGARSLLGSAGIAVHVVGGSLDVPGRHRELAAWFVREAVTNVLRHSDAAEVRITVAPDRVTVVNDGAPGSPGPDGGLGALRARAAAAGAELRAAAVGGTFTAELRLPGEGEDDA